jgi:hypothetical protein
LFVAALLRRDGEEAFHGLQTKLIVRYEQQTARNTSQYLQGLTLKCMWYVESKKVEQARERTPMLDNRLNLDSEGIGIQIRVHYCNRDLCVLFNRQALQRGRYYDKARIHEAREPREILSVAHVPVRDLHRFLPEEFKGNSVLQKTDAVVLEHAFIVHENRGIRDKITQNISINRLNIHSALL